MISARSANEHSITYKRILLLKFPDLPVYASQWPLPDITQDLVRGCELGFAAVSIPGN